MKTKTFTDIMTESISALERMIADEIEKIERYDKIGYHEYATICSKRAIMRHEAKIETSNFAIQVYKTTEAYKGE